MKMSLLKYFLYGILGLKLIMYIGGWIATTTVSMHVIEEHIKVNPKFYSYIEIDETYSQAYFHKKVTYERFGIGLLGDIFINSIHGVQISRRVDFVEMINEIYNKYDTQVKIPIEYVNSFGLFYILYNIAWFYGVANIVTSVIGVMFSKLGENIKLDGDFLGNKNETFNVIKDCKVRFSDVVGMTSLKKILRNM